MVENGWVCDASGCRRDPPNPGCFNLTLIGDVKFNYNNVFVVLETARAYSGLSESEKRNLIKYSFPDRSTEPTSVYCVQSASALNRFECLLVYMSGIVNKPYVVNFSYNFQSLSGACQVPVDPTRSSIRTRSLK